MEKICENKEFKTYYEGNLYICSISSEGYSTNDYKYIGRTFFLNISKIKPIKILFFTHNVEEWYYKYIIGVWSLGDKNLPISSEIVRERRWYEIDEVKKLIPEAIKSYYNTTLYDMTEKEKIKNLKHKKII